jgi:hypothetical protein
MLLIKTNIVIKRNPKTGKKSYTELSSKKHLSYPKLPAWKDIKHNTAKVTSPSYVIRPDDDLVVIDCDTLENTDLVQTLLNQTQNAEEHYIVKSDNGTKHFYFAPTEYFRNSPLYSASRTTADKIDILQGNSLVYPACEANLTKNVEQGSLDSLTPIPQELVDILISRQSKDILEQSSDYEPSGTFRAPLIDNALAMWSRTKDYDQSLRKLMQQITPKRYRPMVKPDYHPDNIPEGEGISYLQALTAKIAGDASISPELHRELITVIATELWSDPLDIKTLEGHLSNLTTQTINGKKLFHYNEHYNSGPLVSIDGHAFKQLCRDADDVYYTSRNSGKLQKFTGFPKLAKAMKSKNFQLMIDGKDIGNIKEDLLLANTPTAEVIYSKHLSSGLTQDLDGTLVYNTFQPSRYLNIIRGLEDAEIPSDSESFPTIRKILENLVKDLEDPKKAITLFEQFLSHKFKTFDYSPLVFHFLGIKGAGKGVLQEQILGAIDPVVKSNINSSNNQFNAEFIGASFIQHDEDVILQSTIDYIKKVSGSKTLRAESKGKDATSFNRNYGTFLVSSNRMEVMKEGLDDRRIVMFMSFTADRLNIPHLEHLVVKELEAFCRHLRDVKLLDRGIYMDANHWRDKVSDEMVEDKSDHDNAATTLALLIAKAETGNITAPEFNRQLSNVCNNNNPYFRLGRGQQVYIPLQTNGAVVSRTQNPITTPLTMKEAKEHGLGKYIKRNTKQKDYNKNVYEVVVRVPTELFNNLDSFDGMEITPIEGLE